MRLYIRSVGDAPHTQHPHKPAQAICGVPLIGAKTITDLQALAYLGDRRCPGCHDGRVSLRAVAA